MQSHLNPNGLSARREAEYQDFQTAPVLKVFSLLMRRANLSLSFHGLPLEYPGHLRALRRRFLPSISANSASSSLARIPSSSEKSSFM